MEFTVTNDNELSNAISKGAHGDRIIYIKEGVPHEYRLEQIWGQSSLALMPGKNERKRAYKEWLNSLPVIYEEDKEQDG